MPKLEVDWSDAAGLGERWMQLDGREFLEQMGRGDFPLPPILSVLDIREGAVGDGWIEFVMRPQAFMLNLAGTVHGGVLATQLPKGMACTTIDLQMRFFRPARVSAEMLTARAEVLNFGTTLGATHGEIRDAAGRLIAHATSSLAIAAAAGLVRER